MNTPPKIKAKRRVKNTAALVRELHKDGKIRTGEAGHLLVTLGVEEYIAEHPTEACRNWIDDEPDTWKDETGTVWPLSIDKETFVDGNGDGWHYAGGAGSDEHGDTQPFLARDDWSEDEVPLAYVRAAVGLTPQPPSTPPRRTETDERHLRQQEDPV